jgi:hypothetical protein
MSSRSRRSPAGRAAQLFADRRKAEGADVPHDGRAKERPWLAVSVRCSGTLVSTHSAGKMEIEWTPQVTDVMGIDAASLPIIQDADFLFGPQPPRAKTATF